MMPDIAAINTAIHEVTTAMPPRMRLIQKFKLSYICFATPERSKRAAMKINNGTDKSTYSVIKS